MKKHPPPISTVRARELRKNATAAELRMKRMLKEYFAPARFRFQVPLRHVIADFASHRAKVVIEIDGGQHSEEEDAARTVLIEGEGCMLRLGQFMELDHPHPAATSEQARESSHPSPIKGQEDV